MAIGEGDILLDSNQTIMFENGDIKIGNGLKQHIGAIMNASPGNFRNHPTLGVGIVNFIDSPQDITELEQVVRLNFEQDGYKLSQLDIETQDNSITNINIVEAVKITDNTESFI